MYRKENSGKMVLGMCVIAGLLAAPWSAQADMPSVTDITVVDVTPRAFSVIWAASEASTGDLDVYMDAAGTEEAEGVVIEAHPLKGSDASIATSAENLGIMKVRVSGLDPGETYYYRTVTISKSTAQTRYSPSSGAYPSVTAEVATTKDRLDGADLLPIINDSIVFEVYEPDMVTPATGALLLVWVSGADYPLSTIVGDGIDPPYALVDLNNLYDASSHTNMELFGGEVVSLTQFRGALCGTSFTCHSLIHRRIVPLNEEVTDPLIGRELSEVEEPTSGFFADLNCDDNVNLLDGTIFTASYSFELGNCCYHPDTDFNDDAVVNLLDGTMFTAEYGNSAPF